MLQARQIKLALRKAIVSLKSRVPIFYETGLTSFSFMRVIEALPVEKPLRFLVERGAAKQEVMVTLKPMSDDMLDQYENEGQKLFQKGEVLLMNHDAYGALECFKGALWYSPDMPVYHTAIGDAYWRIGLTDLAIDELHKAIAYEPQQYAYYVLGSIYLAKEDYANAMANLHKAIAMNPKDAGTWGQFGYCYFQKEMYAEALPYYEKAAALSQTVPGVMYYLAVCYDKLHQDAKAIAQYHKYLDINDANQTMRKVAQDRISFLNGTLAPPMDFKKEKNN